MKNRQIFENLRCDLGRLANGGPVTSRTLLAGLLSQGFQAIITYRFFHWLQRKGFPGQPLRFIVERFIEITCGISIPARCRIGKGLRIHHFGGIIFHPTAELGEYCTLYHGVTIGDRGGSGGTAKIGNHVRIGAGAKIIGEITIGDYCIIGANAVVTKDMPPATVAVGAPCRYFPCKEKQFEMSEENSQQTPIRVMDFRGTYKGGGGPDKTILNSAARHDKHRIVVLVAYLKQPHDEEFQISNMAQERGLNFVALDDRSLFDWRCLRTLFRIIKERDIQVLHTHDDKTMLYGVLLRFLRPRLGLMHTCHSHADYGRDHLPNTFAWYKFRLRKHLLIMLMRGHHNPILTISENTRQRLLHAGLSPQHVVVLENGIDTLYWRKKNATPTLRHEFALTDDQMLVGTVARITFDKDLPTFFEVAASVVRERPGTVFVIVGDGYGNELKQARAAINARGLTDVVRLTGHRTDLLDIYISFDLFLMTSLTEGMPNTILEAMAMELPIVSTRVGGVPELIEEGKSGLLAPIGDADALAKAVLALLAHNDLRQQFSRAARSRIEERFDFAKRVTVLEDYYQQFAAV